MISKNNEIIDLLKRRSEESTDPKEKEKFEMYIGFLEDGEKRAENIRKSWVEEIQKLELKREQLDQIGQKVLNPTNIQFQKEIEYQNEISKPSRKVISSSALARWKELDKVFWWLVKNKRWNVDRESN